MKLFLVVLFCFLAFTFLESKELDNCNYLTEKYGKIYNLPNKLLTSIALVESGIKKMNFSHGHGPLMCQENQCTLIISRKL